jgi:AmiR/NasT family two-component response regulator
MRVLMAIADPDLRQLLSFAVRFDGDTPLIADLSRLGDVVDATQPDLIVLALEPARTESMAETLRRFTAAPMLVLVDAPSRWTADVAPPADVVALSLPVRPRAFRASLAAWRSRTPAVAGPVGM